MLTYQIFKRAIFRPLCRWGFRAKIVGLENMPTEGPVVLASNHIATMDSVVIPSMVSREIFFPVKAEIFRSKDLRSRIVSWFLYSIGMVPMERGGGRASAESLQAISDVMAAGNVVAIYPEGTRSPDGRLYRGHTGVARMMLSNNAPVIPVGVIGTHTVKRFGIPWVHRPLVIIGKPLHFPEYVGAKNIKVHRYVTNSIMRKIQELTGQDYVDVYGARAKHGDLKGKDLSPFEMPQPPIEEISVDE